MRHKYTGQVMVMKEMKNCSEEAKLTFLKEVKDKNSIPSASYSVWLLYVSCLSSTAVKLQSLVYE